MVNVFAPGAGAAVPGVCARPLLLASSSRYRRELLMRLRLPFEVVDPCIDESAHAGESPARLAQRLALAKAQAVARQHPEALVLGSDQVAELAGQALGKPGCLERARTQLQTMSGQWVQFHTAVALVCVQTAWTAAELARVQVQFRVLDAATIERYLRAEPACDCAGSAKSEGLGIALLERIDSDDPTALIGLPLIRTARLLRAAGVQLP